MAGSRLLNRVFLWLRIVRGPVVKVYDGFGDADEIMVQGHVFSFSPAARRHYRHVWLINVFAVLRLFLVKGRRNALVRLEFSGEYREIHTERDGSFRFEFTPAKPPTPGWHKAVVTYLSPIDGRPQAWGQSLVFVPHRFQYSFISDIDDTFLISHSSNFLKRLYVLLTKNAWTRKPFDDVVKHYRLLALAGGAGEPNPFFYVSSSEWNLYDFIREFCRKNELPRGILQLAQVKRFRDLLKTGQGRHASKYIRIARILKYFPHHRYVLLGDDSQKDPEIYDALSKDFPELIFAVYLRRIRSPEKEKTRLHVRAMRERGVLVCHFTHSSEAIEHSTTIGLINIE